MNYAGFFMLFVGTVIGSVGGARLPEADYTVAAVGMGFILLGGFLVRRSRMVATVGTAAHDHAAEHPQGGIPKHVAEPMRELTAAVEKLAVEAAELPLDALLDKLIDLEKRYVEPIADAAPRLLPALGAKRFASIFGAYATGERLFSRAWSAAADHHQPEAVRALNESSKRLHEALALLEAPASTGA